MLSRKGKGRDIRNTCMKPNKRIKRKLNRETFIQENFSDQQWESFDADEPLPQGKSEEMHRFILGQISSKQQVRLRLIRVAKYLSAAAIILMVGFALFIRPKHTDNQKPQLTANNKLQEKEKTSLWKEVANSGTKVIRYQLPDLSFVTIYPASTIKFKRQFDQKLRNVYLQGKARFKVKRDAMRPFSVFSGALKTTALGTSFTINTRGHQISVKLHTGKIVVADTLTKQALAYISNVGTTLVYDPSLKLSKIIKPVEAFRPATELLKREGNLIIMKNIPLVKVFQLLTEAYGIKVNSNQADISKITFTGSVDTGKEKPEDVLKLICLINNMTLTNTSAQEFSIQKTDK